MIAKYNDPLSPIMPPLIRSKKNMNKANLGDRLPNMIFDGMKVDEKGLIWTSAMMGFAVINPL
jgi:sugar lactone lactonase YvrE